MSLKNINKLENIKDGDNINFPSFGSKVKIHFKCYNLEFRIIEDTFIKGEPLEFIVGQNEVIDGLDILIKEMSLGEICKVKIPSSLGYGLKGLKGIIEPNSDLFLEICLVSFQY